MFMKCKLWPLAVLSLLFVLREVEGSLLNNAQNSAELHCSKSSLI